MRFEEWEPEYREILREFGFSREEDEAAAQELRHLLSTVPARLLGAEAEETLRRKVQGRPVVIVGGGPGKLPLPLPSPWLKVDRPIVVAADGATTACLALGTVPDLIVTDLDGDVEDEVAANDRGSLVLVHAHGDNREALERWVPRFRSPIAGSCAGAPGGGLLNPGGFTDGDRSVFVAEAFGASSVLLTGFDFRHPRGEPAKRGEVKRRKLAVARRLIGEVAARGVLRVEVLSREMKIRPFEVHPGAV